MSPVKYGNVMEVPSLSLKTKCTVPALNGRRVKRLLPGGVLTVTGEGPLPG
jgi:hypothetical protein